MWLVPGDKKVKAEDAVKQDDLVSRQSIKIKDASMYSEEKGFFIIIEGDKKYIDRAAELLKEFGEKYSKKETVFAKIDKEDEDANAGVGFILGGD